MAFDDRGFRQNFIHYHKNAILLDDLETQKVEDLFVPV